MKNIIVFLILLIALPGFSQSVKWFGIQADTLVMDTSYTKYLKVNGSKAGDISKAFTNTANVDSLVNVKLARMNMDSLLRKRINFDSLVLVNTHIDTIYKRDTTGNSSAAKLMAYFPAWNTGRNFYRLGTDSAGNKKVLFSKLISNDGSGNITYDSEKRNGNTINVISLGNGDVIQLPDLTQFGTTIIPPPTPPIADTGCKIDSLAMYGKIAIGITDNFDRLHIDVLQAITLTEGQEGYYYDKESGFFKRFTSRGMAIDLHKQAVIKLRK